MSVKIKICGLRRVCDIEAVNKFLPDYAGFVFAESKRKVTVEEAKELIELLDGRIKPVGVFVNSTPEEINAVADYCHLAVVQLHGEETPEMCKEIKLPVWRALSVKDRTVINELEKYKDVCEAFVLDNGKGGTGIAFNWDIAREVSDKYNIFLAGGLYPENVHSAINNVKPYGVDTSTGVETDGWKDKNKIGEFILNAKKS